MDTRWFPWVLGTFLIVVGLLFLGIGALSHDALAIFVHGLAGSCIFVVGFVYSGLGATARSIWRGIFLRRLARKLGRFLEGPVEPGEDKASIRWIGRHQERNVEICWILDLPITQISVQIDGWAPGTFRILPSLFKGGRLIGGRTIPVGHEEFDRTFLARSSPPSLLPDLFSGERRERFARAILDLPKGPSCRLMLTYNDLRILAPEVLRNEARLRQALDAAVSLALGVREAARAAGYPELSIGVGTSARCPVCISPLEHDIVACQRCRTPHHLGCWQYTGACAMFACGSRRGKPA